MENKMTKKIGWQKYEDMINKQLTSPLASLLASNQLMFSNGYLEEGEDEEEENFEIQDLVDSEDKDVLVVPVPSDFYSQINLVTNYECWIGHTNFDITESVKDQINDTFGVEILKVYSRYRFFIGIGRMFDFKDVRKIIEETLT
jgi:hypothetical protein|tara:strand:- start:123 stop:554 length:432 start_codon:yes stop_codon:yes gene_type:complete